jgi:hypothetical protein
MTLTHGKRIALFLVILGVLTSCGSFFDESVTVYPTRETISGKQIPLWRIAFKASFETQTIVYWYPGRRETPERLINCSVIEEDNWVGEYVDHSGKVEMVGGMIVRGRPGVTYVNPFYWWYLSLKEKYLGDSK